MQTLDTIWHPSCADTRDLRHRIKPFPVGQLSFVGPTVGQRKIMIAAQPLIHLGHQALRLQRGAGCHCPRASEVVRRGKGCAVGQPRLGYHDGGFPARTAVCNAHHAPRRSLQLRGDCFLIGCGHGFEHSLILAVDRAASEPRASSSQGYETHRTTLRSNYRHAALGGTTRRNYREVRLTNAEWAASCERRPQRRILDVRAAGLQEEDDGTTLFRYVSSDEDGGDPANIAASGASNQTQHDARAAHRKGATPTWMIAAVSP